MRSKTGIQINPVFIKIIVLPSGLFGAYIRQLKCILYPQIHFFDVIKSKSYTTKKDDI
jgi:hypothetical protein